jgi:hypothetical protein
MIALCQEAHGLHPLRKKGQRYTLQPLSWLFSHYGYGGVFAPTFLFVACMVFFVLIQAFSGLGAYRAVAGVRLSQTEQAR